MARSDQQRQEGISIALTIDRLIDPTEFNRRKERMLIEQADLEKKLADAREKALTPKMVDLFLERLKNLTDYYIYALPEEKREILQIATSNREVINKNAYLEPSEWLIPSRYVLDVLYCAHYRHKDRTIPKVQDEHIEALVTAATSEEFARLNAVLERCERSRRERSDEQAF